MNTIRRFLILIMLSSAAPLAHAHPGHEHAKGLLAKLLRELTIGERGLMLAGVVLLVALLAGSFRRTERRPLAKQTVQARHRHLR